MAEILTDFGRLPPEPGIKLLQAAGLVVSPKQMVKLVAQYSGNPLALKLSAATIQDFYTGDIDVFLAENTLIFGVIGECGK